MNIRKIFLVPGIPALGCSRGWNSKGIKGKHTWMALDGHPWEFLLKFQQSQEIPDRESGGKSKENSEQAAGILGCSRDWETNPKSMRKQGENPRKSQFIDCKQEQSQFFQWNYPTWSLEKSGFGSQGISPSPQTQSQGRGDFKSI